MRATVGVWWGVSSSCRSLVDDSAYILVECDKEGHSSSVETSSLRAVRRTFETAMTGHTVRYMVKHLLTPYNFCRCDVPAGCDTLLNQGPGLQQPGHCAGRTVRWSHEARAFVSTESCVWLLLSLAMNVLAQQLHMQRLGVHFTTSAAHLGRPP